jgi:hypothetical protein
MSMRGEVTESIRRQVEYRVREGLADEDENDFPSKRGFDPTAPNRHPPTLFEPEAWLGRFGVRCAAVSRETKNP